MNSRTPSPETTATIVTVPEPGQALPPNGAGSEATPDGTAPAGDPAAPGPTAVANTGPTPLSPPPVSEKVSRFFPLFKRQSTVNLPIPPKPPLPNAEALNALANQPKETLGEADVWAQTARSRALALLESDRAKARLKPRSDPRTGTSGVLAAREARPPFELVDNQESVLPVSLEINTNGARDRAAIARPVNRPGRHMSDAIANSAMRQAYEPKPDPWSPYANAEAMNGSKTAVTLGTPTDASTFAVTEPAKLIDEPAQPEAVAAQPPAEPALPEPAAPAQDQPEPAKEAEVAEAAPVATDPESDAIPQVNVAEATPAPAEPEAAKEEPAVEPPAPSVSTASPSPAETETPPAPSIPTAAAEPVDLPAAAPAVPGREPFVASQEVAAPVDMPREVPLTQLTDRIELPPEIDAESESRSASKLEPATERVSLSETSTTANVVRTRDLSDMVTDPPKAAPVQPKPPEKPAAKPPTPEAAQPAPAAKPAESPAAAAPKAPAAASTANDPPAPKPAAEPEPKPAESKPSEPKAEEKPAETTPPAPAPAVEPAPAPSTAPAVVPTPRKSIEFPRMTKQVGQGVASPQSAAAVSPVAPNKVLPEPIQPSPEPLTAPRPAPAKTMPAVDPNQDPGRIPIWSPYNNLPAQTQPVLAVPSKAKPSESPTAGWKIPPRVPKQTPAPGGTNPVAAPRKVFPSPQVATATAGTTSILANRDQVVGSYDLNGLFPATYQGAITRGAPPLQRAEGSPSRVASRPASKRKSILGRFLARFQREDDDTPVPTPADAIAGRVNPQGLWKVTPLRPSQLPQQPESIAAEPRDIPQGGEGIQRVSAYGLDEPPQR